MREVDMVKVELEWYRTISAHIDRIVKDMTMDDSEKVESVTWLIKQLKKTDKED